MTLLLVLALSVLAFITCRAMDKAKDTDIGRITRVALTAIVTLVLTYTAMRVVPPEAVPDLMSSALRALKAA
ncbi:hypothetical protein ACOB87_44145 [Streptomyces sp. YS-B37]|uniref:hypothetical protein n=1 Tax=Streptomyces sp. YS-B37 TaxID=3407669 RepID=UPI003B507D94